MFWPISKAFESNSGHKCLLTTRACLSKAHLTAFVAYGTIEINFLFSSKYFYFNPFEEYLELKEKKIRGGHSTLLPFVSAGHPPNKMKKKGFLITESHNFPRSNPTPRNTNNFLYSIFPTFILRGTTVNLFPYPSVPLQKDETTFF